MKNDINAYQTLYYENGDITTAINFKFVGYGSSAQPIYRKIVTTFSIANGIIKCNEPQTVRAFYR